MPGRRLDAPHLVARGAGFVACGGGYDVSDLDAKCPVLASSSGRGLHSNEPRGRSTCYGGKGARRA
jgi:hypothetical protein